MGRFAEEWLVEGEKGKAWGSDFRSERANSTRRRFGPAPTSQTFHSPCFVTTHGFSRPHLFFDVEAGFMQGSRGNVRGPDHSARLEGSAISGSIPP